MIRCQKGYIYSFLLFLSQNPLPKLGRPQEVNFLSEKGRALLTSLWCSAFSIWTILKGNSLPTLSKPFILTITDAVAHITLNQVELRSNQHQNKPVSQVLLLVPMFLWRHSKKSCYLEYYGLLMGDPKMGYPFMLISRKRCKKNEHIFSKIIVSLLHGKKKFEKLKLPIKFEVLVLLKKRKLSYLILKSVSKITVTLCHEEKFLISLSKICVS